jgi:hypothetical protein
MENMLKRNIRKSNGFNSGANMVQGLVGLTIGLILSIAVVIPVTEDVIDSTNLSGTAKTILELVPIFTALLPMVLVVGFL